MTHPSAPHARGGRPTRALGRAAPGPRPVEVRRRCRPRPGGPAGAAAPPAPPRPPPPPPPSPQPPAPGRCTWERHASNALDVHDAHGLPGFPLPKRTTTGRASRSATRRPPAWLLVRRGRAHGAQFPPLLTTLVHPQEVRPDHDRGLCTAHDLGKACKSAGAPGEDANVYSAKAGATPKRWRTARCASAAAAASARCSPPPPPPFEPPPPPSPPSPPPPPPSSPRVRDGVKGHRATTWARRSR